MTDKKNILILCYDNYQRQPRVLRTIEALEKDYTISVAGHSELTQHKINFINLNHNFQNNTNVSLWYFNKPAIIRFPFSFYHKYVKQKYFYKPFYYEFLYWTHSRKADFQLLKKINYELIISHGADNLPLAIKLGANKVPVIFNAHEFYEREFEENENWKKFTQPYYNYLIQTYLKEVDLMFCVCESIQNEYLKKCKIKSLVITNATKYNDLKPTQLGNKIRIIHHGAAIRSRELERMAELVDFLGEEYELTFMLVKTDLNYYNEFFAKYSVNSRIKFTEPVKVNEIPKFCNQYDIGIFILPPVNYNWENALPNKVFEYVQARLALAVSPNVNMRNLVNKYKLGVVAEDYTTKTMASALMKITREQISQYKYSSNQYALKLSAEENYKVMLQSVNQLIN